MIQTAKLKTDLMLSQEVGILMPEQLEDVQNHIPMLEFWTCIYRHDFLTLNGIRFYEYRQQDVETAFRYLAYSYAGNICIDTFMNFYLQRDNLQSNTHTWNTYHLHQIKSSIYYDLYKRTPCKGDCAFLYRIIVEQLAAYYKLCHEYGYDSKSGFETMHKLFSNIKKLPSTLQTPELSAQLKQIGRWDLKTRIFGPKLRTSSDTPQKKHVENPAIPLDVLFQRLTDLSPALLRIK